jgi:hypothetical protein
MGFNKSTYNENSPILQFSNSPILQFSNSPILQFSNSPILLIIFLLFSWLPFQACDALTEKRQAIANEPEIVNGIATFKSAKQFEAFMRDIDRTPLEEIQERFEERGFKSLAASGKTIDSDPILARKKATGQIRSVDYEGLEMIEDYFFGTVLNEDGFISVEGLVFRVTYDYVFFVHDYNVALLYDDNQLYELTGQALKQTADQAISASTAEIGFEKVIRENFAGAATTEEIPAYRTEQYTSNPARRAVGESWNTSWHIYSSMGVLTKNQKRNFSGLWLRAPADMIALKYEYSYHPYVVLNVKGDIGPDPNAWTGTRDLLEMNKKDITRRIDFKTMDISTSVKTSVKNLIKGAGTFKVNYIRGWHQVWNAGTYRSFNTEYKKK